MNPNRIGTVAVVGANGMLGHAVAEYFTRRGTRVIALGRDEYDIARDPLDKLGELLRSAGAVVNCAGVIKPMIATTAIEHVLRVNTVFPRNLALLGDRLGFQTIHVTTDCAYSGHKGSYTEADVFDADDVYGMSKIGGDVPGNMTLRTSIIGEEKGPGRSLLEWARSQRGRTVSGFLNHRWNGVTTVHLAEVVYRILDEGEYRRGIFHVHSPHVVTKFELLTLIDQVYELGLTIRPVDADVPCDRSLASTSDLSRRLCVKNLRQQLEEMRRFFAGEPIATGMHQTH